jgi:hypothetical protein
LTDVLARRKLTVTPAHMLLALLDADSELIRRVVEASGTTPARIREAAAVYLE